MPDECEDHDAGENPADQKPVEAAARGVGRGASNLFGGWLEVPLNIHRRRSRTDSAASYFTGAAIGAFRGLARTGVGVYEVVTFFIPIPQQYAPILPTLEYFQKNPRRERFPLEG